MTEQDISTLLERSKNTQGDIVEIKTQLTIMNETWFKNFQQLQCSHNRLNGKVQTLIGVLAGLGILGGGTAGILKILGY